MDSVSLPLLSSLYVLLQRVLSLCHSRSHLCSHVDAVLGVLVSRVCCVCCEAVPRSAWVVWCMYCFQQQAACGEGLANLVMQHMPFLACNIIHLLTLLLYCCCCCSLLMQVQAAGAVLLAYLHHHKCRQLLQHNHHQLGAHGQYQPHSWSPTSWLCMFNSP